MASNAMVSSLTRPQRRFLFEMVNDPNQMFFIKRAQSDLEQNYASITANSLVRRGLVQECSDRHGHPAYALTGRGKMFLSAMRYFQFRREQRS